MNQTGSLYITAWAADRFAIMFESGQSVLVRLCFPVGLWEHAHSAVQHMYRATIPLLAILWLQTSCCRTESAF